MASDTAWLGHDDFIPAEDATIAIPPPAQTNAIGCDPPTVEKTVHPAEASGPSEDPKLPLMGLPAEVRLHLFRYLLVKDSEVYIYSNGPNEDVDERYRNKCSTIGVKIVTSILRVNKKAAEEGLEILYGENIFMFHFVGVLTTFLTDFETCPEGGILKMGAYKIKVVLGVPFGMKPPMCWPNRWYTALFLSVLCPYLLNLKQLTLTTYYADVRKKGANAQDLRDSATWTYQGLRGFLAMAAAVTEFHSQMRKAFWRPWRGPIVERMLWEDEDGEEVVNEVCHEWFIDIFRSGSGPDLKHDETMKDAYADSKAVVLNSPLIRRLVWEEDGYVGDLKELFLPNDVQSSELNMERLWYWEHVAEYLGINADLEKLDGWRI
ncbi:hypothetical protein LTR99_010698 [Exophiala xenobiotica]|uniref:Uncharacterized protein n=1 Tax=Vermiconidia calcicola TaxID=1690605 RepID=A0AAV9Q2J1_9PEZI|nr:hypothetical protein LTR96_001828 [Exophiala xenobiotica]KAK5533908.1 hypothetical protein LTR25_006888 [Vermiconidia calcicola]KAK5546459.1 hypothetical protein LTR23_003564 [Chaetothyriales sp. CCFEE 6169]KAK5291845.1 hypothetical protein LTR99_010698 [Exophiala xenobiotica]KAK5342118.1 hypothetical protein LTR98_002912 [Exophiala xenobiotica]